MQTAPAPTAPPATTAKGEPGAGAVLRVAYLGNFMPGHPAPYSTESHVAASLEELGHQVVRLQEGTVRAADVPPRSEGSDLFLWTQTLGLADTGGTVSDRADMLRQLRHRGIPSVGFHLDRWWGLGREGSVWDQPFFRCDVVYTADGGHDEDWRREGVNHRWSPPAVYGGECFPGHPRGHLRSDVAFVGSWKGYAHDEWWPQRKAMLDAVRARYGRRFRCWPQGRAVRGSMLNDLYTSAKVVVGDSCLAGGARRYWSDRIPETLGRGGFLIHPWVEGVDEHYRDGEHLRLYPLGDHDALLGLIEHYLTHPQERERIRAQGQAHVRARHTYAHRMRRILSEVLEGVPA